MTTDRRTTDVEYRLSRLEKNVSALTGMVESLVAIRHVGAYVPPTKPHVRGVEPTWAILDEAAELEHFAPFDEAAELQPWTSAAASTRDEIERIASDSGLLSRTGSDGAPLGEAIHDEVEPLTVNELIALPFGAVVQDSDWEEWEKTLRGWYMRGMNVNAPSACPLSSKLLFDSRGPLTARATD